MIKKHPRFATREYWMAEIDKREAALDRARLVASQMIKEGLDVEMGDPRFERRMAAMLILRELNNHS